MWNHDSFELSGNAKWVHESSASVRIKCITGHKDSVNCCQLINDDEIIFTASSDKTARLWDFKTGKEIRVYSDLHNSDISSAKVCQDNTKFVTSSWDRSVKLWDLETGSCLWKNKHEYLVTSCGFSYDQAKLVVSVSDVDFVIKIWDTKSGKLVRNIKDLHDTTVTSCQFTPKNDRIITTSMDKTCKFYDLIANQATIFLNSHKGVVSNCSITNDERRFATCSWDKTIQIWDIATGNYRKKGSMVLSKGHEGSVSSCCISKDGLLCASSGYDNRVVLWDMVHGLPKLILRGHTGWCNDVALTSNNKWIVTVGKDKEIRQWDIENCDDIKLVMEQNKNLGSKLTNCSNCQRAFTMSKLEKSSTENNVFYCVFCRLQNRQDKNPFLDIVELDSSVVSAKEE